MHDNGALGCRRHEARGRIGTGSEGTEEAHGGRVQRPVGDALARPKLT